MRVLRPLSYLYVRAYTHEFLLQIQREVLYWTKHVYKADKHRVHCMEVRI